MEHTLDNNYLEIEQTYGCGINASRKLCLTHGEGVWAYDDKGNKYLDFCMAHGSVILGHCHPQITEAVSEASKLFLNCGMAFANPKRALLIKELSTIARNQTMNVFLCNSGAEAIEAAIKIAKVINPKRKKFVALRRAFHGRTIGALSLTFNPKYKKPFNDLLIKDVIHIKPDDIDSLNQIDKDTCAVILELVQGEGGVYPLSKEFVNALYEKCKQTNTLFIVDEIQTGAGRCGDLLFVNKFKNITPDIICAAKGFANGIPIGITLWKNSFGKFPPKSHGTTYGGNPFVCQVALKTLKIIKSQNLHKKAEESGSYFVQNLRSISSDKIKQIRHAGLLVGIELNDIRSESLVKLLQEKYNLLALPASPQVLRFLPPLIVEKSHLDIAAEKVENALKEI